MVFRRCSIAGVEYCQDIPYDLSQDEVKADNVVISQNLANTLEDEFNSNQVHFVQIAIFKKFLMQLRKLNKEFECIYLAV